MIRRGLVIAAGVLGALAIAAAARQIPFWVDSYLGLESGDQVPTYQVVAGTHQIVVAAEGELSGVQTTWLRVPRVKTGALRIAWLAPNGALLGEGDVVVRFDDGDARIQLEESTHQLDSFGYRIARADTEADGQRETNLLDRRNAELELDYSERQVRRDETIFSQWEIRESLVSAALARYRKGFTETRGALQQRLSRSDRELLTIESSEAERDLEHAREALDSLTLRMPADGVVLLPNRSFNPLQPGVDVYPGSRLLEVASLRDYRGKILVTEKEAATLEVGQAVRAVIPARSDDPVEARLTEIAPVARQFDRRDPRKYFECVVTLVVGPDLMAQLRPGMKLRAEVVVSTLTKAVVIPKSALHREESGQFVYVQGEEGFSRHPVTVRGTDHAFAVVDGLQDGARVALRSPDGERETFLPDFSAPAAAGTRRFLIAFD